MSDTLIEGLFAIIGALIGAGTKIAIEWMHILKDTKSDVPSLIVPSGYKERKVRFDKSWLVWGLGGAIVLFLIATFWITDSHLNHLVNSDKAVNEKINLQITRLHDSEMEIRVQWESLPVVEGGTLYLMKLDNYGNLFEAVQILPNETSKVLPINHGIVAIVLVATRGDTKIASGDKFNLSEVNEKEIDIFTSQDISDAE